MDEKSKATQSSNRSISQLIGDGARVLPGKSHGWFRNWFRKVWKVRGGGLYALGFALSFIVFEVGSLGDDIMGIGSLFNGQALEFVIQFLVDSFKNTLKALIWPIFVLQFGPPWGAIGLGITFFAFTRYLKAPIERWLFPNGLATDQDAG